MRGYFCAQRLGGALNSRVLGRSPGPSPLRVGQTSLSFTGRVVSLSDASPIVSPGWLARRMEDANPLTVIDASLFLPDTDPQTGFQTHQIPGAKFLRLYVEFPPRFLDRRRGSLPFLVVC